MKTIRCDLPFAESIEIHPMSDLHIGDAECDYKMVMDRIEYIKNTKDAYCVSGSNSSVSPVDKLFVNTAAALNYGGYGDKQGFKPASKKSPVIYLDGLKHEATAKL